MAAAFVLTLAVTVAFSAEVSGACQIPAAYHGVWFYLDDYYYDHQVTVTQDAWGDLQCAHLQLKSNGDPARVNATLLLKKTPLLGKERYYCYDVYWRSPNVLSLRLRRNIDTSPGLANACPTPSGVDDNFDYLLTLFNTEVQPLPCETTYRQGSYGMEYDVMLRGGGACSSGDSTLQNCGGSGLDISFGECPDTATPTPDMMSLSSSYNCLGSWYRSIDGEVFKYVALSDMHSTAPRLRFKCLILLADQETGGSTKGVISHGGLCGHTIWGFHAGPVKFKLSYHDC